MSNQISSQATKVWQTISDPKTINSYQQSLDITWQILKETGILLWLIVCLSLVAFDWFWLTAVGSGRKFRAWFDNLDQTSTDRIASEAGRSLLEVGKTGFAATVSKAREQLGYPPKPEPAPEAPTPALKPQMVEEPATPTPVSPSVTTPASDDVKA